MSTVLDLIDDLIGAKSRPESPRSRPPETRVVIGESPQSPLSPAVVPEIASEARSNPTDPCQGRLANVVATLEADAALHYAIDVHAELDPEDVIVSLAIRDKGACEVRIPKSRYDAFRLMEAIERHTGSRTLQ